MKRKNLSSSSEEEERPEWLLDKRTIQDALGKCQQHQRMWGVSGSVILGVQLEIEAGNHLQVLELLGTMAIADDIVHLEGTSNGLTLWFSGPRQSGTSVASCCSEAHPFGSASFLMLQPRSQYVALVPMIS